MAGKYEKQRPGRKFCRFFYILNLVLLVLATVKIFRSEIWEQKIPEAGRFLPEARASAQQDTCPPEITGAEDILIYAGETVDYDCGIAVTDDRDDAPTLETDSALVDGDVPGSYPLTYYARDAAGNCACVGVVVTVLPRGENYVDMQTVMKAVDTELAAVVTEEMPLAQKVRAIYDWAHSSLSYHGHTDRTDLYQAAYRMLTTRQGDCYGYFAASKLMLERLGIPTIDVEKVKNHEDDSNHYWSMVSIDGGKTYYHFDCTPRLGVPFDFCLITDSALDGYSAEHKFSHNRDRSAYPATPEA